MPASLRIIKIVKDKDPMTNEEKEDYTVEMEVEAEDSAKLAIELAKCPYGNEIVSLLKRAEFLPEETSIVATKEEALKEEEALNKHDEELRQSGRDEMYSLLMEELRDRSGTIKSRKILSDFKKEYEKEEDDSK